MKKVFLILFLTIFLFNTTGYYILYKIAQYHIKNEIESEIKKGINNDELIIITVAKNDRTKILWEQPGKEIRFNDEFYDVVNSFETPDAKTYYCISDKKEDSLFASLDDHIKTHVTSNIPLKNSKKLIEHVVKLYFSSLPYYKFDHAHLKQNLISTDLIFTSIFIKKIAQPPELT